VTAWLVRRLAAAIAIVFAVVTITFVLIHLAPGMPFGADDQRQVDPEVIARLRRQFGLDQPLPVQYVLYLRNLLHGELGQSFSQHRPVAAAIADAIPPTLTLAGAALVIDLALGLALGLYQVVRARRFGDIALGNVALFFNSMPTFWLGLILLLVFGQWLHVFPVGGMRDPVLCPSVTSARCLGDLLWHLTLPASTLGLVGAAATARYQRAAMLEVAGQDYVRTARAKGLRERRVLLVHVLRNALLPFITLFGLAFPFLLTGAVLVERVFAWPGMGRLSVAAIFQRDYPLVTGTALVASGVVVLAASWRTCCTPSRIPVSAGAARGRDRLDVARARGRGRRGAGRGGRSAAPRRDAGRGTTVSPPPHGHGRRVHPRVLRHDRARRAAGGALRPGRTDRPRAPAEPASLDPLPPRHRRLQP